jgi:protein ImuA
MPQEPCIAGASSFVAARAFEDIRTIADLRLVEMAPAAPGEEPAATGFALAWARAAAPGRLIFWAAPERTLAEHGAPCAEGLAEFGLDLGATLIARTKTQIDALWAAEQALTIAGAFVLCTVAPSPKALDLTATRRLFLAARKHKSRCALIRLDAARASAAQLRFEISSTPGESSAYGLAPPAFDVRLARNRAGPAGQGWRLQWCAHEYAFRTIAPSVDGGISAVSANRPVEAILARAG